jgi:hypothetical protein
MSDWQMAALIFSQFVIGLIGGYGWTLYAIWRGWVRLRREVLERFMLIRLTPTGAR